MTQNTQSPSRLATGTGDFHRLSKWIVAGILAMLVLAVILTSQLQ